MSSFWYMIKFFFHRKEELYFSLKNILGFYPHNIQLYELALMHKSLKLKNENGKNLNNERLEFLGDAVIETVVSDIIFHQFSHAHEGFLTTTRSKLVQRSTLNRLAEEIGLKQLIKYTRSSDAHNSYIGGNAFEALVGAIYLYQGYKRAFKFINRLIEKEFIKVEATARKEENFKSALLEWCQKHRMQVRFDSQNIEVSNPDEPCFQARVFVETKLISSGKGFSKKESHQSAAKKAVHLLRHTPDLCKALERRRYTRLVITDIMEFLPEFKQLG